MRVLVGGMVALAAALGSASVFTAGPADGYPGGPYQIYIFDGSNNRQSTYGIAVGDRTTAAIVEDCAGRLADDPNRIVASLRERTSHEGDDLGVVWVVGNGSRASLGTCGDDEDDYVDPEDKGRDRDSIVVISDASAAQVRQIIREIPVTAAELQAMIEALGLNRREPARR